MIIAGGKIELKNVIDKFKKTKLYDLILFLPGALIGTLSKTIRTNIPELIKDYIEKEHLYHFTEKETVEKIIESRIYKTNRRIK